MRTIVRKALGIATVAAGLAFGGAASADPIDVQFNIATFGQVTCSNPLNLGASAFCGTGTSRVVSDIQVNNIGLVLNTPVGFLSPNFGAGNLPLTVGLTFFKTFTTAQGLFTEALTVTVVTSTGLNDVHMEAEGTISCSGGPCLSTADGTLLTAVDVFFSVSYTKNPGPGQAINASFNNSTTPPNETPEPGTLALLGLGLAAIGFARRRKQS